MGYNQNATSHCSPSSPSSRTYGLYTNALSLRISDM